MTTLISLNGTKPVILIDMSYYIFNRYYATISWFRRRYENYEIDDDIEKNDEFLIAFFRHFDNDMNKLVKKFKTLKTNIIFCLDCSRCDIWRNEFYDGYKMTRTKKQNFDSSIFVLFKNYISNNDYVYCEADKLEADDIVYLIQKQLNELMEKIQIIIITNDNDYLQMYRKNIIITNMQFKDLTLRITSNPEIELMFKIIYGDKSDNIQKIQYGLNKEGALRLAMMNNEDREKYMIDNKIMDKYLLNRTLVDLREIPKKLIIEFNNRYNIILNKK
jgi:5'-3' exonuclease